MKRISYILILLIGFVGVSFAQWKPDTKGSGKGLIIYKYEGDADEVVQLLNIVRPKVSTLLEGTKYPQVKKAVEELESRIDRAIKDML